MSNRTRVTAIALGASAVLALSTSIADLSADVVTGAALPEKPLTDSDFYDNGRPSKARVELGRLLFFDKILSGNRNISCATCHHPEHGTSDGVALSFGEGARGLGPDRRPGETLMTGVHDRMPRNSPALFNLGARQYTRLFHDGRVETDPNGYFKGGFVTPAKFKLPQGLDNVLAAQAMFPVTSPTEMAGQKGENDVANARALNNAAGKYGVWDLLGKRLQAIPEYVMHFRAAFPERVKARSDVTFVLAANAIAAFEASAFRADGSPFDQELRGKPALSKSARAGMKLFYGAANCSSCHSGPLQTDHEFHAIGMPQIGPGKSDGRDPSYWNAMGVDASLEDFGRGRETLRRKDNYAFRTPSLRNVELTAPYGHAGTHATLEQVVRHHLDPSKSLAAYRLSDGVIPPVRRLVQLTGSGDRLKQDWMPATRKRRLDGRDGFVQATPQLRDNIAAANQLKAVALSDTQVEQILAFLKSLTDPRSRQLRELIPAQVPSGLPVND